MRTGSHLAVFVLGALFDDLDLGRRQVEQVIPLADGSDEHFDSERELISVILLLSLSLTHQCRSGTIRTRNGRVIR